MLDIKILNSALEQLEEERKIPKEKILEAIEQSLAAAYKKEYGKKGQIVRCKFDPETGETTFEQVKIVVDDSIVRIPKTDEEGNEEEVTGFPFRNLGSLRCLLPVRRLSDSQQVSAFPLCIPSNPRYSAVGWC